MKLLEILFTSVLKEKTITRENIIQLIEKGMDAGIFDYKEGQTIKNIVKLGKVRAEELMIPRVFVTTVSEEMTTLELHAKFASKISSYLPVYTFNKNTVTGYVSKENVFESLVTNDGDTKIKELKKDVFFVMEDESVYFVWIKMMEQNMKLAIVVDSFNEFQGIINVEDITEVILGSGMEDEYDRISVMKRATERFWYNVAKKSKPKEVKK